MKLSLKNVLRMAFAGLLTLLAAPALAQLSTTANGPYYATPSWDQKLTTSRFVILANWNSAAVLDRETGLVWQRTPETLGTFFGLAVSKCLAANTGGRYGWRLATYHELSSLQDSATKTLPAGHPFLVDVSVNQLWWSATRDPTTAVLVFVRNLISDVVVANATNTLANTWCVRGGQGVNSNW